MFIKVLWAVLILWGCHSSSSSGSEEDASSGGNNRELSVVGGELMRFVEGTMDTVVLGTNRKGAKYDETPEMRVFLNYDFWMDSRGVTCGEFKSVMKKSTLAKNLNCGKDENPVVNVTFFDAVLYANEKSKKGNLDTVYEYSEKAFDKAGHCVNLKGFSFHLDKAGFRLPTEAEWVKVASKADGKMFTFSENVKEFVNDFKGLFNNAFVENFAGASNTNGADERIVKGGVDLDLSSINLYSRGDTYAVTSSTFTDYVGFRLALGAIPNATFLDQSGKKTSTPIKKVLSALDLWDYSRTSNVKLVFRNDGTGNLNYVDYTDEQALVEIEDSISAYHPDISPDGERVAFCTGLEGVNKKSKVYVRNLDSTGSGLVKLNVESAAIPRWKILENGDTVITYVSNAGDNSNESTFKGYSTWQVPFAKGKFGTPTKLFEGSYHGGISEDGSLAVTGAKRFRVRLGNKEKVWYNGEQACNVSLVQDMSKRTSFLDFGSKTGKKFVGTSYRAHEYLLVADSTGKLVQSVGAPAGYAFDHSEWAVGRVNDNLVATLTNAEGAHTKIVLIHLSDSSVTSLVEGEELWHPSLWIRGKTKVRSNFSSSSEKPVSTSSSSGKPVSSSSSSKKPVSSSSSSEKPVSSSSSSGKPVSSSSSSEKPISSSSSSEKPVSSSSSSKKPVSSSSSSEKPVSSSSSSEKPVSSSSSSGKSVSSSSSSEKPVSSSSSSEKPVSSSSSSEKPVSSSSSSEKPVSSSSSSYALIENFVLDEDSAGFYVKSNEFQEAHWSYKMELVWTYMESANVAIFGSSRPHHGVIPSLFSDQFFAVNFASAHGSTHSSYYMAVNYVLPHYKKLKYIIIGTSFDRLYMTKLNSFFYLYAPDIKGYVYDVNHDFWKTGVPEGLLERTQDVPKVSSYRANLTERGYMPLNGCGDWNFSPRVEGNKAWYDTSLVRLEETFGYLTEIIELAAQKGVKVIGVEFPQNPNYKNMDAYGKYGMRNSDAPKILERFHALEKKYSNFTFFDQHKMGEHDYLEGMSYDDDHLCRAGAEQITHRLDSLLKTLE